MVIREEHYKEEFEELYEKALKAGKEAGENHKPTPMRLVECDLLDRPCGKEYVVEDGPCGFAWINIKPGNSRFANWLKDMGYASKDEYYGGVTIWISDYNQSYEKKYAHAKAMSGVFKAVGIRSMASGRLD